MSFTHADMSGKNECGFSRCAFADPLFIQSLIFQRLRSLRIQLVDRAIDPFEILGMARDDLFNSRRADFLIEAFFKKPAIESWANVLSLHVPSCKSAHQRALSNASSRFFKLSVHWKKIVTQLPWRGGAHMPTAGGE
jgi:hypothetical protein